MNETQTQTERNVAMYGIADVSDYEPNAEGFFGFFDTDAIMFACSILSDAQQTLEHGDSEACRQLINRAKHVLFAARRDPKCAEHIAAMAEYLNRR